MQLITTNKPIKENNLLLLGILANVIGVLEHINYYHRQLMIDNLSDIKYLLRNKRLKVASLKKAFMKAKYKTPAANSRLPQWGLTWLIEVQYIYQHSCLVDSLVFQNSPLRQAAKRYGQVDQT